MDAEAAARALHAQDPSAEWLGIELVGASADRSEVRMTIRPEMCNGYEIIHGGMTFLLADSAMAFASNTTEDVALATNAEIDWLAPARAGQVLTAVAERAGDAGRTTIWNVALTTDDGTTVALFRGRTRRIGPRD